jgi:hypothetical protein
MRENYSSYSVELQEKTRNLQSFINSIGIISGIVGFLYLLFWTGAVNDDFILQQGKMIFDPIASLLFGNNTTIDVYKNTGFALICAMFPIPVINLIIDKFKDDLIQQNTVKNERIHQKQQQEAQHKYATRYDGIRMYSICLSLDYESEKGVKDENKSKLNNVIYSKIKQTLKLLEPQAFISLSDVLIFSSDNFKNYDNIYDTILKELSSIKKNVENNYNLKLVPSMTTDAYDNNFKLNSIRQHHFEIQSFNFKNRAVSSATFANKYKHLKHNKYAGIPIGEYAYFRDGSTGTYELNVIHKNLNRTLSQPI